jgi:hypothetical protein
MRWHHHEPRAREREVWSREGRVPRKSAQARALLAAAAAGAKLRSDDPVPGWVAPYSRDGKTYVCNPRTQGARPAWVWAGDVM